MSSRVEAQPTITHSTWAEVSLPALRRNFHLIRAHVGSQVEICAVVKAHAYGHGAAACGRALEAEGARWFGVTNAEDGAVLREAGVAGRILLMTGFWRGQERDILALRLTPTVWTPEHIALLQSAASQVAGGRPSGNVATAAGGRLRVHLKIDTGMGRLGASLDELPALMRALAAAPQVELEAVCTHLASSEVTDSATLPAQERAFAQACGQMCAAGLTPRLRHMANTAAMLSRPSTWLEMVRPGLALYGYCLPLEGKEGSTPPLPLEPVLTWKTRIVALRHLPAGRALGYGGAWVTPAPARIAILPVGYADGLNRRLFPGGRVLVRGHAAPIVGNISMDITLADVTAVPGAEPGDEVVLLGRQGQHFISADEHARLAATIPYEILCNISKRVPRVYIG
jgi:alanine racemase